MQVWTQMPIWRDAGDEQIEILVTVSGFVEQPDRDAGIFAVEIVDIEAKGEFGNVVDLDDHERERAFDVLMDEYRRIT